MKVSRNFTKFSNQILKRNFEKFCRKTNSIKFIVTSRKIVTADVSVTWKKIHGFGITSYIFNAWIPSFEPRISINQERVLTNFFVMCLWREILSTRLFASQLVRTEPCEGAILFWEVLSYFVFTRFGQTSCLFPQHVVVRRFPTACRCSTLFCIAVSLGEM